MYPGLGMPHNRAHIAGSEGLLSRAHIGDSEGLGAAPRAASEALLVTARRVHLYTCPSIGEIRIAEDQTPSDSVI